MAQVLRSLTPTWETRPEIQYHIASLGPALPAMDVCGHRAWCHGKAEESVSCIQNHHLCRKLLRGQ